MSESPLFPAYGDLSMLPARAKEDDFNQYLPAPQRKSTKGAIMRRLSLQWSRPLRFVGPVAVRLLLSIVPARVQTGNFEFNDSHFHLTNNVQEGPDIHDFLNMMGSKAGRVEQQGVQSLLLLNS